MIRSVLWSITFASVGFFVTFVITLIYFLRVCCQEWWNLRWQILQLPINRFGNIEIPALGLNVVALPSLDFNYLVNNYVLLLTLSVILGVFRKIIFKWTQFRSLSFRNFCPSSSFNVHLYSVRSCSWLFFYPSFSGCLVVFGLRIFDIIFSSFGLSFKSSRTSKCSSLVVFPTIFTIRCNMSTNSASLWSTLNNTRFVDFYFIYTGTKNEL